MNDFFSVMKKFWVLICPSSTLITVLGVIFNKKEDIINKISSLRLKKIIGVIYTFACVVFGIIALTSAIIGVFFIEVPNVCSMSIDNAIQTLNEQGFKVQPYQDAYFEIHRSDTVLYQSIEAGSVVRKGTTIYISYKHYDESKDDLSSDVKPINDESISSSNSFPTSSTNISPIEPIHSITYNHSANIVNGGFCCYDDGQYFFGDSELKKSSFPYTNDQTIIYNGSTYYLNPVGDYLYFTTPNKNNSICRVKKDGTNFEVIYSNPCHELTYFEGWLYFCSNMGGDNYHICRMNPDDLEVKMLYDCREWYMSIYNDRIFFCNCDENYNIYSMNLDGTDCKPIYCGECYDLCVANNKICFSQGAYSRQLYCIDLDGGNLTLLRDSYTIYTNCRDDKLYYVDSEGLLCKCNLDGTQAEIVQNLSSYSFVVLLPDKIICSYDRNLEKNIIILET